MIKYHTYEIIMEDNCLNVSKSYDKFVYKFAFGNLNYRLLYIWDIINSKCFTVAGLKYKIVF